MAINPQAGLGAMMQAPNQPQQGMPASSMAKMMDIAKKMSDGQLADILAGKNMDVPQFVAMTEAMGRKQLRTALQGQQAMAQAKQPTAREKLLSEMTPQPQMQPQAGIAAVPAPNMETANMASGGIVAFDGSDGSLVSDPTSIINEREREKQTDFDRQMAEAIEQWKKWGTPNPSLQKTLPTAAEQPYVGNETAGGAYLGYRKQQGAGSATPPERDNTPFFKGWLPETGDKSQLNTPYKDLPPEPVNPVTAADAAKKREGLESLLVPPTKAKDKTGGGTGTGGTGVGAGKQTPPPAAGGIADALQAKKDEALSKRKNYLDELTSDKDKLARDMESVKSQGQGEFLMQMAAALMSTPNLGQALAKGTQAGLPGLAANRKEINAMVRDQRDYNLNLAKAQEARQQGDEELAFKYESLAEQAKYHAGMVAYHNRMVDAYSARAAAGAGGIDAKATQAALAKAQDQLKLAMADPRQKGGLRTQEAQFAYLQNAYANNLGLLRGTGGVAPAGPTLYNEIPQNALVRD